MPTTDTVLSTGPATVEYLATGTGPGVLLVHGTGADAQSNWGPLTEAIADRFTVVAVNLPGAGATADAGGPLTVEDLAALTAAAAEAAGLDGYHLVGHSLGAVVATAVAAAQPDRARSLLVHGGWATTDPRLAFQFELWARLLRTDSELLARLLQLTVFSPATLAALSTEEFEAAAQGFGAMLDPRILRQVELDARVDIADLLPTLHLPTLIVASAYDQVIPTTHQRELAAAISGAEYLELPAGHALPFEAPTLFVSTVTGFLDKQEHAA
ncbi:pimeloyl-ACP methyl ester carboxylesterase [Kitasatospora sp. MAA4]|uniref:alpha/beta fold hydrolase n=1 Tax=Kitasatospora sp. MAA4 TaxID=3035093 RepID=UPI002476A706|nr:alpha/beta hydrolase [Kitasatospora sp. MAA4]MDH6134460.1 pimeloyl-ACP methyl ester carboxylesterase [Kitasatospora sp. MAA4]